LWIYIHWLRLVDSDCDERVQSPLSYH
jgi:hypothetical protein